MWHYDVVLEVQRLGGDMAREISNCLIDNLAERVDYHEYRGRARVLSSARSVLMPELRKVMDKETQDPRHHLRSALIKWDAINREQWMVNFSAPDVIGATGELDQYLQQINGLRTTEIINHIAKSKDIGRNKDALIELVLAIEALLPQQQGGNDGTDPSPTENKEGADSPEQGEGTGSEGAEGSEQGSEETPSSDDGSSDDAGESQTGGAEGNSEDGEGSESDDSGNASAEGGQPSASGESGVQQDGTPAPATASNTQGGDSGEGTRTQQSDGSATEVDYSATESQILSNYNKDLDREPDKADNMHEVVHEYYESNTQFYLPHPEQRYVKVPVLKEGQYNRDRCRYIAALCEQSRLDRKLRKYLQLKAQGRTVHGVKRGRISGKSLHRLYNNTEQLQPRVFKKHEFGKVKTDSACTLLVDLSGSMGMGSTARKYCLAAASAIAFAEVLVGLRIKHEILGFTEHTRTNEIYQFKLFEDKPVSKDNLAKKFSWHHIEQDHNTDGEALQYAAERLMRMKEQNKVLMVMSDGMPAGHFRGSGAYYLHQVVDDVENHSPIHLCGIGIDSSAVRNFYSNSQVIRNIDELPAAVLETLKSRLIS